MLDPAEPRRVLESPPMDQEKKETAVKQSGPHQPPPVASVIHRVCIQCNNMFTVDAKNFEAKQCPACHKG